MKGEPLSASLAAGAGRLGARRRLVRAVQSEGAARLGPAAALRLARLHRQPARASGQPQAADGAGHGPAGRQGAAARRGWSHARGEANEAREGGAVPSSFRTVLLPVARAANQQDGTGCAQHHARKLCPCPAPCPAQKALRTLKLDEKINDFSPIAH